MIKLAAQLRELVSSNVEALIDKASDPAKMLRMLQSEVEEKLIDLHRELGATEREAKQMAAQAKAQARQVANLTDKAKQAVDGGREELAREALLAREIAQRKAVELAQGAKAAEAKISELVSAITGLEAKRQDLGAKARAARPKEAEPEPKAPPASTPRKSKVDEKLERIDELERRMNYRQAGESANEDEQAHFEAEIAKLRQRDAVEAELAAMKASKDKPDG